MTRKYTGSKYPILLERKKIVENWLELKSQGVNEDTLFKISPRLGAGFSIYNKNPW